MHPIFERRPWELSMNAPWRAISVDGTIEITQPEGLGAVHISNARKREGFVSAEEILAQISSTAPADSEFCPATLGDFKGKSVEYVDWHGDRYWKRWFVACRMDLVVITYTCRRGDEEMEIEDVEALLSSLRSKDDAQS
jgi:hypothetical protein